MLERDIFAGFGGQGVLLMGQLLAQAGLYEEKQVAWLPSYGPEMRGGTANCSVTISDKAVASPIIDNPTSLIVMNRPSLDKFEDALVPGGKLFINSSIIDRKSVREDITVVYCDAMGIADQVKNPKGANVAILGAMLAKEPIVGLDKMEEAIKIELGEKKMRFFEGNKAALLAGIEAAK